MTSRKKLILNLDSNEHIITETKIDKPEPINLNNVDIINVDTSTLNKKKVNNNLSNSNLDTLYEIDSQLINSNNNTLHNNNNTQDTDKLNKYLEQKLDIERKINKLNKRIKDPKYDSKKSLYISDLDKCNIKLQKLEKNINIYKLHNKHPNNNFNTNNTNNTNYVNNINNINNGNNTNNTNNINNGNNTNNINKSKMSKSGLMQNPALDINYLTKQNINSNISTIENELNKLESDLKLTESVIPLLKPNTSTHLTNISSSTNIPSSTNVNNISIPNNKLINNNDVSINNVNVNNMQTMQTTQNKQVLDASKLNKLKVKKEASLSAPVSINSQLKTLKEKETFYKEQQRRIQEKFKLEMQKINKLKQQQQEIQKLKEIDKQKKKTFILEQKLKKIERYKFLINKLTNLECIYTVNNDNNASKNLINKDKSINKVYQPYTHTNNVKIINPNTIRQPQHIPNTLNTNLPAPSITTTPITNANNSYFNKFINYVNTLGFMGVGESIPLTRTSATLSPANSLNITDKLANTNNADVLQPNNINSNIDVIYSINSNYALLDYKCKYLSDPIKYYDYVDTLWNDLNIKNAMISVLLNCNKYNECNKLLLGQDNIIYDKIDVDTLNDMIKKNDYNISRCYFNKYSNNFKLQQFKDNCNYMAFNYENVLDNTLFKNKFVSYSQLDKYKLIDFINQYYQYMDKSFNVNLIV